MDLLTSEEGNTAYSLVEIARMFTDIGTVLHAQPDVDSMFDALTSLAVERVPGAEFAGITLGVGDHFTTRSASAAVVVAVDRIQYELQSGPCVAAAAGEGSYTAGDLDEDGRWPEFGHRTVEETGIRSMYAAPLYVENEADTVGALNFYAREANAFGPASEAIGVLLATHGALAVAWAQSREHAANLEHALRSNREIGVAMGVLMHRHQLTRDQAFDLLRVYSQHTHRKLSELAEEVADTGMLPDLPTDRGQQLGKPEQRKRSGQRGAAG